MAPPDDQANATLRQSPEVVSSRLGEGGVLVHLRTNRIFELNATGLRAWELMATACTRADLLRELGREFDVDRARLEQEIAALLDALAREGLVHACDGC